MENRQKKLILLYPYKFVEFHWKLFELDEYTKYIDEVEVWDLSNVIFKKFSSTLSGIESKSKKVIRFRSFGQFFLYFRSYLKRNKQAQLAFINEIPRLKFRPIIFTIILFLFLKRAKYSILEFYNPGIPNYSPDHRIMSNNKISKLYKYLTDLIINKNSNASRRFKLISLISHIVASIVPNLSTHNLVAGKIYELNLQTKLSPSVKLIKGHSFDYSNYLISENSSEGVVKNNEDNDLSIVYLDSPSPKFSSDAKLTQKKVFLTVENWYPALNLFFDYLESTLNARVKISSHYKSDFRDDIKTFQGREVKSNETLALIKEANLVITRLSTAVSFAVLLRKPVLLIYSDELFKDGDAMQTMRSLSNHLGTQMININELSHSSNNIWQVNETKYASYANNFLTSNLSAPANSTLILSEIFKINFENGDNKNG
jgi:hypothetical protein